MINLLSKGFASLQSHVINQKYYNLKRKEVERLHKFSMRKIAYIQLREQFLEEILNKQANSTADAFYHNV